MPMAPQVAGSKCSGKGDGALRNLEAGKQAAELRVFALQPFYAKAMNSLLAAGNK